MIAKEQVKELIIIGRDLEMALVIKEQIDAGEHRGLAHFADGVSIKVPIPAETKNMLDLKILNLTAMLKEKAREL